jgi:hypothetical protein
VRGRKPSRTWAFYYLGSRDKEKSSNLYRYKKCAN